MMYRGSRYARAAPRATITSAPRVALAAAGEGSGGGGVAGTAAARGAARGVSAGDFAAGDTAGRGGTRGGMGLRDIRISLVSILDWLMGVQKLIQKRLARVPPRSPPPSARPPRSLPRPAVALRGWHPDRSATKTHSGSPLDRCATAPAPCRPSRALP